MINLLIINDCASNLVHIDGAATKVTKTKVT